MINAIELENFKPFGKRTRIELAPITLLYGENSAGKTAVMDVLELLKQTRQQDISENSSLLTCPRKGENGKFFGAYHEFIYGHDVSRQLKIRLDIDNLIPRHSRLQKKNKFPPSQKSWSGNKFSPLRDEQRYPGRFN